MTKHPSQRTGQEYVDVRDLHPGYTRIPCPECDETVLVSWSVANKRDEWWCSSCKPGELRDVRTGPRVTVRL